MNPSNNNNTQSYNEENKSMSESVDLFVKQTYEITMSEDSSNYSVNCYDSDNCIDVSYSDEDGVMIVEVKGIDTGTSSIEICCNGSDFTYQYEFHVDWDASDNWDQDNPYNAELFFNDGYNGFQ